MDLESCVHPALASDNRTLAALRELGLRPPSPDSRFRRVAERVFAHRSTTTPDEGLYESFWVLARRVGTDDVIAIIHEHEGWPGQLRIKTRSGDWQPSHSVLMPGDIVPGDGSRDDDATVDMAFHHRDVALLSELGRKGRAAGEPRHEVGAPLPPAPDPLRGAVQPKRRSPVCATEGIPGPHVDGCRSADRFTCAVRRG